MDNSEEQKMCKFKIDHNKRHKNISASSNWVKLKVFTKLFILMKYETVSENAHKNNQFCDQFSIPDKLSQVLGLF